jgi:hypothetical protein
MTRRRLCLAPFLTTPLAGDLLTSRLRRKVDIRTQFAIKLRQSAAVFQITRPIHAERANGDETTLPSWIACFTKGLQHNQLGEVEPQSYKALLAATASGKHADFERIHKGAGRKLSNPEAAFAFQLEGGDSHQFSIPPAPSITSLECATETAELYWQALCRDVSFSDYDKSSLIQQACNDLNVTPAVVFRGPTKGDHHGPYISQFLWKPIPYGCSKLDQRYRLTTPGADFMTAFGEWHQIQSGVPPWREAAYHEKPRYVSSGRDLAECVHYDFPYQAFLNAALILLDKGPDTILNTNPFGSQNSPYCRSKVQEGFVTFGSAEITDWLARMSMAALKASWCQKWMVHRRLRPEALGGLLHQTKTGVKQYPVHSALLNSAAVEATHRANGTYLLPQSYPEGSPLHPSYPAAHAAIGGACSVALKTFFNESMLMPGCVVASPDGLSLLPCSNYSPTVGAEVNKLAFNIAMGRNWAGIHYRSDATAGLRLGEDVAISVLQDLVRTYTEDFKGFSFTRLDGTRIRITPQGKVVSG